MDGRLRSLTQRYSLRHLAVPAVAVGLFFVWFETVFRAATPLVDESSTPLSGWFLVARADVPWITSLVAGCLVAFAVAGVLRVRARRPSGHAETSERLRLPRRCAACCVAGGLLMAAGSVAIVVADGASWASVVGGAAAGVGMVLLLGSWLPASVCYDGAEALLVTLMSVLASIAVMLLVTLLDDAAALALLVACPLASSACALAALRSDLRLRPSVAVLVGKAADAGTAKPLPAAAEASRRQPSDFEVVRPALLNPRSIAVLLSVFSSFLVLGIIGIDMDMTLGSASYWYVNLAGVVNMALLAATLLLFDRDRLQSVLALVVSTAIASMPLSLAFLGETFCFVLTKVAGFCAYALAMLHIVENGAGQRDPDGHMARGLTLLALVAADMAAGLSLGDLLRRAAGPDGVAQLLPLVAVALLYLVFIVYVLFVAGGTRKIKHVITGSFDDEAELARVRRDVILQGHPDVSARESDVLLLLLQGYPTARIAGELCISENTAKTHVRHIYAKLKVNSRAQLMALAEETPYEPARRGR